MKAVFRLFILLCSATQAPHARAASESSDESAVVVRMISDEASISDRVQGFILASQQNSDQINAKLISLLDSPAPGGKSGCMVLLPSWHGALCILVERFPECGIEKRPIAYDRTDAELFKKWWSDS